MATEQNDSALAKFGPIGAPILGVVVAIGVIAGVFLTSGLGEKQDKISLALQNLNSKLDSTGPTQDIGNEIPNAAAVKAAMDQRAPNGWAGAPKSKSMLQLPMLWRLKLPEGTLTEFQKFDKDRNLHWDEYEFAETPYAKMGGRMGQFKEWDKNGDKLISEAEYKLPPLDDDQVFDGLNKNGGDYLDETEISKDDILKWDWPDANNEYDGRISRQEFADRDKPKPIRNLAAASDVKVVEDREKMEIVVTWTEPSGADIPEDQSFFIYRLAPETVEKRKAEHRQRVLRYSERLRAWQRARDAWWDEMIDVADPANAGGTIKKRRSTTMPGQNKDSAYEAAGNAMPVVPEEPSDWELVTETPITGSEYRDSTFEGGVTYTYRVHTATTKLLLRGQKPASTIGTWKLAEPAIQTSQPVMVAVRTWVEYVGSSGDNVNLRLTRWHRVVNDEGDHDGWYRFIIEVQVASDSSVGGKYRMAEMRGFKLKVLNSAGIDANPAELNAKTEVDFATGWAFRLRSSGKVRLDGNSLGTYELPEESREPAVNLPSATGKVNPLEVRLLASNRTAAAFHLTRWHRAGGAWYRVELTHTGVAAKGEVGRVVELGKAGSDVKVFDSTGKQVTDLSKLAGESVDMKAGTYDGMDKRNFKVDGATIDIWGVYYK